MRCGCTYLLSTNLQDAPTDRCPIISNIIINYGMLLVGMRNFIRYVIAIPSVGDGHQAIYDYKTNADNILVKGDPTMYEFFRCRGEEHGS
jgi:hypothetical protein